MLDRRVIFIITITVLVIVIATPLARENDPQLYARLCPELAQT